jgi:hypothetical protein
MTSDKVVDISTELPTLDDLVIELHMSAPEFILLLSSEDSVERRKVLAYVRANVHASLRDAGLPGLPGYETVN